MQGCVFATARFAHPSAIRESPAHGTVDLKLYRESCIARIIGITVVYCRLNTQQVRATGLAGIHICEPGFESTTGNMARRNSKCEIPKSSGAISMSCLHLQRKRLGKASFIEIAEAPLIYESDQWWHVAVGAPEGMPKR